VKGRRRKRHAFCCANPARGKKKGRMRGGKERGRNVLAGRRGERQGKGMSQGGGEKRSALLPFPPTSTGVGRVRPRMYLRNGRGRKEGGEVGPKGKKKDG